MSKTILRKLVPALAGAALLGACIGSGDEIAELAAPNRGGEVFQRYVALGNSITAGFQSAGINDSTQLQAYPVLLAGRAGAYFNAPLLNKPGCPPPFVAPLGQGGRLGGGSASTCALRSAPGRFGPVQNLAVPGATIGSGTSNAFAPNALTTFILGGRTQAEAMIAAEPTLVTVWLGNNDVLGVVTGRGAALPGDTTALTPVADFQAQLNALVGAIGQTPAAQNDAVVLIGVVDVNVVPLIQPGAFFFLARDPATGTFQGKPVNANCSPVDALGQPNPLAANLVNFSILSTAIPEISCANDAPLVLNAAERTAVSNRVTAFNNALSAAAQANGWIFVNPNQILAPFLTEVSNGRYNRIRKCQLLASANTPALFQAAVLNSCPVTGPTAAPNFFGSLITFDGVHPSAEAHVFVTNALAAALNERFSLSLPTS